MNDLKVHGKAHKWAIYDADGTKVSRDYSSPYVAGGALERMERDAKSAVIPCLTCTKNFESVDRIRNRICPRCTAKANDCGLI
jgi:hypothetical protein